MKKRLLKKRTKAMIGYIMHLHESNDCGAIYINGGHARLLMRGIHQFGGCDSLPITVFNICENYNIKREYIFSIIDSGYFYPEAAIFNPENVEPDSEIFNSLYLDYTDNEFDENEEDYDYSYNDGIFDTIEDE